MFEEFKSDHTNDKAADKALKCVSVNCVEQLNLFDTTLHLYEMDGLTALEVQKLQNNFITELERKQYLITVVIPSKGHHKGMVLLKQALKKTGQNEILNILEKEFENAIHEISKRSEVSQESETTRPVQATFNGYHNSIISTVCSESGLVSKEGEDVINRSKNPDGFAISTNSSANYRKNDVLLQSPVEQVLSQPQSDDDFLLHFPQSISLDSQVEYQPQPQDEGFSLVEQQLIPVEQFLAHSDNLSLHQSQVTVEPNVLLETDGASSHKSPVAAGQLQLHSGDFSLHKSLEQKVQVKSDGIPSCKPPVTAEQQFQSQLAAGSSLVTVKQQSHPQSTSQASPVIVKQEPQTQSYNSAPLNSLTQQQSGSQVTPYFKVRLPPMYSGTVTFALTPSSHPTVDQIPDSSNCKSLADQIPDCLISKSPEQNVVSAPPGNSCNNSLDHDNGATTSLDHDKGVTTSLDHDNGATTSLDHDNGVTTSLDHDNGATSVINDDCDILRSIDRFTRDYSVMKFVFVGDTATGKTSLLERYVNDKFCDSSSTTIIDFRCVDLICYSTKYQIHLWDTAGQERYKAFTRMYYRDAVGIFVVYDVTRKASLEHSLQWKKGVDEAINGYAVPVVLLANKIDCGRLDGEQFSKENGFTGYFETSAKTGAGIKEAIQFTVKKVHEILSCADQEGPVAQETSVIKLHAKNKSRSRRKCCK